MFFYNVNVPDSSCHNTPFNLNQTGFIISHDMKENEEDSGLRVSTLNNVNGVFDAKDAKVRKFVSTGCGYFTCHLFHVNVPDFSYRKHSIQSDPEGFRNRR